MSLITVVQKFCQRSGLPSPATVMGSTDKRVIQIMALLEEEGNDLSQRHPWTALEREATFLTVATESQGSLDTIAPFGFRYIRNDTIWDRNDRIPILQANPQDWQALKAISNTGPRYQYRFRGNNLLVTPTPVAGHTWAFEYQSENWILDTNGTTTKSSFTADTDSFLLDDNLLLMGLRWRWMKEEGLSYAELFASYELQVKDAMGRDGGSPKLYANGSEPERNPNINIKNGNWFL